MSTAGGQNDGAASARGDTRRGRADASGDPAARPDTPRNDGPAPLAGIVVVELGASVAAPYAAQTLGDLGAQVWKIEKAEGDDARRWGPPFWEGTSALFQGLNRNKRSVVCDLRDPAQVAALIRFIEERADVVLQNLRPGQAEALGLGAGALTARKPSLVFCNIGAFGAAGPLKDRPGYDPLMQAFGGIMSFTGEEGRPPVRVGSSIIDMGTGLWGVVGIVTALFRRSVTGKGAVIDVSLFETASALMSLPAAQFMASGELPRKQGSGSPGIVPYRAYRTADGDLVVAAGSDGLFGRLSKVLGHPEWADDPRFLTNPKRVENQHAALRADRSRNAASRHRRMDRAARRRRRALRAGAERRPDAGASADRSARHRAAHPRQPPDGRRPAHEHRRRAAAAAQRSSATGRAHARRSFGPRPARD